MARNGSGTYSLPAGNPVVAATTVESTWANLTMSDIASALTQSLSKDGQTTMTGNLPMGGNKVTGLGTPTSSTDAATKAYADAGLSGGTLAGTMAQFNTACSNGDFGYLAATQTWSGANTFSADITLGGGRATPSTGGAVLEVEGINWDIVSNGRSASTPSVWGTLRLMPDAAYAGLVIKGDASQSASLIVVQDSSETALFTMASDGGVVVGSPTGGNKGAGATNAAAVYQNNVQVSTLSGSETLTNKTLTGPVISSIYNSGTLTLPTGADTLVGRATTDTLTNKTLTSPAINGAAIKDVSGTTTYLSSTGALASIKGCDLDVTYVYKINNVQVVGARITGWGSGNNPARTNFDTATVTTEELAKRVSALIADLTTHGIIGT